MSFFDQHDIPFTYALASEFPVGERYFGSTLCQTYPNRRFLFTGTASGLTATSGATFSTPAANGTIFDRLDRLGISWKTYYTTVPSMALVPNASTPSRQRRLVKIDRYYADAASGHLPSVSFVEPNFNVESQENPQDIQFGERFLERVVRALMRSPAWEHSALFITYDEHGGYYDHVPPPRAIKPDSTPPRLKPDDPPGAFDRYGFRVPLIAVSPYARANYVSRVVQDHTSILRFIEARFVIPAMTARDANALAPFDMFDFAAPPHAAPPAITVPPVPTAAIAKCKTIFGP
jgi:phospholipase C